MVYSQCLYDEALKYYGLAEVPAHNRSNTTIKKWIVNAFSWFDGDDREIPWCGIFMAEVFKDAGLSHLIPKEFYRARSWAKVGKEIALSDAIPGDLLVYWRGRVDNGASGHIAFFDGNYNDTTIDTFGGNQGDSVSVRKYQRRKLITVRRVEDQAGIKTVVIRSFFENLLLKLI